MGIYVLAEWVRVRQMKLLSEFQVHFYCCLVEHGLGKYTEISQQSSLLAEASRETAEKRLSVNHFILVTTDSTRQQTWKVFRGSITKGRAIVKFSSTNELSRANALLCRLPILLIKSSGDHACVMSNCPQSPCRRLTLIKCSDFCFISFDKEWAATTA